MIVLLRSVTMQFRRLFWHISYYKVRQSNFITKCERLLLQSASGITKCERLLLQSASGITKCDRLLLQVRQVLQSVTSITKWLRHKTCFTVLQGFIYQVLLRFKFACYHITFIFQIKLINFWGFFNHCFHFVIYPRRLPIVKDFGFKGKKFIKNWSLLINKLVRKSSFSVELGYAPLH